MNVARLPVEYVLARCVLLDALDALGPHRDAVVLVGAQAVYLHTGDADLTVAPTTTDADIALAPDRLRDKPLLEEALRGSGFTPGSDPGMWRGAYGVGLTAWRSISWLLAHGRDRRGPLATLAARAVTGLADPDTIVESLVTLVDNLLVSYQQVRR